MTVPPFFRGRTDRDIRQVDAFDITTGVGYKTFYAGDWGASGANHVLSTQQFYSEKGTTSGFALNFVTSGAFDVIIEKPMTVEGESVINMPIVLCGDGDPANIQGMVSGAIIRVRDGVSTALADSAHIVAGSHADAGPGDYQVATLRADLPNTLFQKDDILRLAVSAWVTFESNVKNIVIVHDPRGRTTTLSQPYDTKQNVVYESPTALTMSLPIVIKDL